MNYEFTFEEIENVVERIDEYYDEVGCDYHDVVSENGVDYCALDVCIQIPELRIAVRQGMAFEQEDEDEQFDIVLIYDAEHLDYNKVIDIYSNTEIEMCIEMIAHEKGVSDDCIEKLRCFINTEANIQLEEFLDRET